MKKFSVICGLALAMLAAGCAKDATTDINPNVKTTLSVSLDGTRTYLGEAIDGVTPILWSEGDAVAINGTSSTIPAEYVGQPSAAFSGVVAADEYNVFYPAALLDAESVGGNVYTIPTVQPFVEGSFAPNTSILVGYAAHNDVKTSVALKNVYGYLKITLTGAANVKKVYVSATADEAISGTFEIDYKTAAITPLAGQSVIRVMGVQATAGTATVVVAVPAGTYAEGFTVKAIDASNYSMTKTIGKTAGVEIARAQLYALPSLAYVAADKEEVEINDATELNAFFAAVNTGDYSAWENNGEVVLGNDIDLTGVELTATNKPWTGVFNGQGYALKNWVSKQALFTENRGTIKNLVIDSSCSWAQSLATNGSGQYALVAVKNNSNGVISGIESNVDIKVDTFDVTGQVLFGSIAAYTTTGQILNCVNNGDIELTNMNWTAGANVQIGGIAGHAYFVKDEHMMANCINNGSLTVTTADGVPGKYFYVGGVLGTTWQSTYALADQTAYDTRNRGIIYNCVNNGAVTCERKGVGATDTTANIGGVVGFAEADVEKCVNTGNVTYTVPVDASTACARPAVAGVVAGCLYSVKDCENYGKISVTGSHTLCATTVPASGEPGYPCIAGIVGVSGNDLGSSNGDIVSGCKNYGEIYANIAMPTTEKAAFHFAGVVAMTHVAVSECENHGDINATSAGMYGDIAGVVGRIYEADLAMSDLTNNAPISFTTTYGGTGKYKFYVGAVLASTTWKSRGSENTATVKYSNLTNTEKGDITFTGKAFTQTGGVCNIGGISSDAGTRTTISSAKTFGDITINGYSAPSTEKHYVGAITSHMEVSSTIEKSTINSNITVNSAATWYIGGIVGEINGSGWKTIKNSSYEGTITASNLTDGAIGGVAASNQNLKITTCSIDATILNSTSVRTGSLVGTHGNSKQEWNDNTIKFDITAGGYCGILGGYTNATAHQATIGTTPNKVKAGSKINGVAVTAADCADINKLYGYVGTASTVVLADGGVVLE